MLGNRLQTLLHARCVDIALLPQNDAKAIAFVRTATQLAQMPLHVEHANAFDSQ